MSIKSTVASLLLGACFLMSGIAVTGDQPVSRPSGNDAGIILETPVASAPEATGEYVCGDANGDGEVNVADVVFTVNYVFKHGPAPDPIEAGDANGDGVCNVGDAVATIGFVFKGGPPIVCEPLLIIGPNTGCKSYSAGAKDDTIPEYLDCADWSYDGSSVFYIDHINTIFNCCPDILLAYMTIVGDEIVIHEDEDTSINGGCDCVCLFDFSYHIVGLPPGHYTFTIIEKYPGVMEPVSFEVDLTATPSSGIECVHRQYVP